MTYEALIESRFVPGEQVALRHERLMSDLLGPTWKEMVPKKMMKGRPGLGGSISQWMPFKAKGELYYPGDRYADVQRHLCKPEAHPDILSVESLDVLPSQHYSLQRNQFSSVYTS